MRRTLITLALTAAMAVPAAACELEVIYGNGAIYYYNCDGVPTMRDAPMDGLAVLPVARDETAPEKSGWRIARVYRSSQKYLRAVIETDATIFVQCAATDTAGNSLSVSGTNEIKPPMDEVIIRDRGLGNSARCWVR